MEDSVPIITCPGNSNLFQKVQIGSGNKPIVVMCKYVLFLYIPHCKIKYPSFETNGTP